MKKHSTQHRNFQIGESLALLGILLAPFIIRLVAKYPLWHDLYGFVGWVHMWEQGSSWVYVHCHGCNYPIVGMFFSAGIMSLIKDSFSNLNDSQLIAYFRTYLQFIDILNSLVLATILRLFNIRRSLLLAFLIYLLPSTWAGGAQFGQIDVVTQLFILLSYLFLLLFCKYGLPSIDRNSKDWMYLCFAAGLFCIVGGTFNKQLFLFSLPGLLAFACFVSYLVFVRHGRQTLPVFVLCGLTVVLAIVFLDSRIQPPSGFSSHLLFVLLGGGSAHGNSIDANGFNMWTLVKARSALAPFVYDFSPKELGLFFYSAFCIFVSFAFVAYLYYPLQYFHSLKRELITFHDYLLRETLAAFFIFLALLNLGFNVFMTGTHERYLYHFYPFLFAGMLILGNKLRVDRVLWILAIIGAVLYGLFVYMVILGWEHPLGDIYDFFDPKFYPHAFPRFKDTVGYYHTGLLILLTLRWFWWTFVDLGKLPELSNTLAEQIKPDNYTEAVEVPGPK